MAGAFRLMAAFFCCEELSGGLVSPRVWPDVPWIDAIPHRSTWIDHGIVKILRLRMLLIAAGYEDADSRASNDRSGVKGSGVTVSAAWPLSIRLRKKSTRSRRRGFAPRSDAVTGERAQK